MKEHCIQKTNNRSVLGNMNDFSQIQYYYPYYLPAEELSKLMIETPCRPLGYKSPEIATRDLFA